MADANLIKNADLARVREQEFVEIFTGSIKKLMEALGVTRKIAKQAGYALKSYRAVGTLEDGEVAEGDVIPLSKYETEPVDYGEITLKKWRKATSAEAIIEKGYDQAVTMTTDKMLSDYGSCFSDVSISVLCGLSKSQHQGVPETSSAGLF